MNSTSNAVNPGDSWAADELEPVPACPACGRAERRLLLDDLCDNVFFVAPGRWSLYRCGHCRSAYLDPRPTPGSIGKAYGSYYTHAAGDTRSDPTQLRGLRFLRRMLANGYMNRRYGTAYLPASALGAVIARFMPGLRQLLDVKFRYLPAPSQGQRLLDIGCGNGDFLATARDAGWDVMGLEPDPAAAAIARAQGLDVRVGSIESLESLSTCFAAITLNHVIEHMHAPREALERVNRLLEPGGVLYMETPNIDSRGAAKFGRSWRGLECPRHLVLFTPDSLKDLLSQAGFTDVVLKRRPAVASDTYLSSSRMALGLSPYGAAPATLSILTRARLAFSLTRTRRLEFITLTARKQDVA